MYPLSFDAVIPILFWSFSATSGNALVVSSRKQQNSVQIHREDNGVGTLTSGMQRKELSSDGATLFCWAVLFPTAQEVELAMIHVEKGMLARCDAYAIYSNVSSGELSALLNLSDNSTSLLHIEKVIEGPMRSDIGGVWNTAQNWPIFEQVWQKRVNLFAEYNWTVKIDLDTVFNTQLLRNLLASTSSSPGDQAITIAHKRAGRYRAKVYGSFNGPIEVFSQMAISKYIAGHQDCEAEVALREEDWYMEKCMELIGAQNIIDFRILFDLHVEAKSAELRVDSSVNATSTCAKNYVAFHPLKTVESMQKCISELDAQVPKPYFMPPSV
mmetsp:Transcript_119867/g.220477  ORF Transcript_119867/g.220477 Transcript_119867/m.220477 type:complete len:327 (+) Transcript_119867:75-1055(+)